MTTEEKIKELRKKVSTLALEQYEDAYDRAIRDCLGAIDSLFPSPAKGKVWGCWRNSTDEGEPRVLMTGNEKSVRDARDRFINLNPSPVFCIEEE